MSNPHSSLTRRLALPFAVALAFACAAPAHAGVDPIYGGGDFSVARSMPPGDEGEPPPTHVDGGR
jgi:hypothetical protein